MKNKFNVAGALFSSCFMGISMGWGDMFGVGLNLLIIVLNLWCAGFFEDSK
jgi:hypothetical protein